MKISRDTVRSAMIFVSVWVYFLLLGALYVYGFKPLWLAYESQLVAFLGFSFHLCVVAAALGISFYFLFLTIRKVLEKDLVVGSYLMLAALLAGFIAYPVVQIAYEVISLHGFDPSVVQIIPDMVESGWLTPWKGIHFLFSLVVYGMAVIVFFLYVIRWIAFALFFGLMAVVKMVEIICPRT